MSRHFPPCFAGVTPDRPNSKSQNFPAFPALFPLMLARAGTVRFHLCERYPHMTMFRWIPVLLLVTACGGSSPTAPSPQPAPIPAPAPAPAPPPPPTLNLSGEWGGVFAFSIDGQPFSRGVVVNIIQDGTHVVGNYSAGANGQQGAVDLTLSSMERDATIAGTIGVRGTSTDPNVRCTGTGRVTGTASPFTIRSLVVPLDNCDGAMTAVSLTMTR